MDHPCRSREDQIQRDRYTLFRPCTQLNHKNLSAVRGVTFAENTPARAIAARIKSGIAVLLEIGLCEHGHASGASFPGGLAGTRPVVPSIFSRVDSIETNSNTHSEESMHGESSQKAQSPKND